MDQAKGIVYLVGAGPGDPGLITLKGKECLQKADVIVYDYLISESLLSIKREDAEIIYVGKKSGQHTMSQGDINRLLVKKAKAGCTVVRLKGGDPFIFGRGGEEAMELSKAGVKFEIVPGVTSAIAVPTYAGIPLTHRDYSSTVCFITGHEDPTKEKSTIDWDALAKSSGTLVFLMGIGNLKSIAGVLMEKGKPGNLPVAVIGNGTMPNQKTVYGTLEDIDRKVKEANLKPPGVIVVGDVVNLGSHLNWFESKPLFGKTILVTRPEDQAQEFAKSLSDFGARCLLFPAIKITPPLNWKELDSAIECLSEYNWILFTSANGVRYFFERLNAAKKDARQLAGIKIGVIGPNTSKALMDRRISPDLVPEKYWAEGIMEEFKGIPMRGKKVLLPRPVNARDYLPKTLRDLGAVVHEVEAYKTVKPEYSEDQMNDLFKEGKIDIITFTSPSAVENFINFFRGNPLYKTISEAKIACIGSITAQKAIEEGLTVAIKPDNYTVDALATAIVDYYKL
ncbi:MAG TPA: uroporphyrinogen-III C-methyltransferase [Desulfatiglandales bacterium]|nr:uroporphyrinogen-III C-methyltransferase [Desulfatiglandales bacterium]